jgi:branched-chain amino acid transport system substrate-binding protein
VVSWDGSSQDKVDLVTKVRAANPDVLGGATRFEDAVAITRQMKALNVNPKMTGLTVGVDLPKFYEVVGRDAEFVYGATRWESAALMYGVHDAPP